MAYLPVHYQQRNTESEREEAEEGTHAMIGVSPHRPVAQQGRAILPFEGGCLRITQERTRATIEVGMPPFRPICFSDGRGSLNPKFSQFHSFVFPVLMITTR